MEPCGPGLLAAGIPVPAGDVVCVRGKEGEGVGRGRVVLAGGPSLAGPVAAALPMPADDDENRVCLLEVQNCHIFQCTSHTYNNILKMLYMQLILNKGRYTIDFTHTEPNIEVSLILWEVFQ